MKKVILVFFTFIFFILVVLLFLIDNNNPVSIKSKKQLPDNPIDLSRIIVIYENTMNGDGLYKLIVDECKDGTLYEKTNSWREKISENYLKQNVDFLSEESHDFTDIKCQITNKKRNKISINCKGTWNIKNTNGEVIDKANINNNVYLISVDGKYKYCPKSCCDFNSY